MADIPFADYDASDPVAENNAHRDEVRRRREDGEQIRHILSHPKGRTWFYRILNSCHIYTTPFVPDQPETTFFEMGKEYVGKQMMMQAITSCADLYLKMLAEADAEEKRLAGIHADEEKKRQGENDAGLAKQGFDLAPPAGWPGHVPPLKPEENK